MARFINPFSQYQLTSGAPNNGGFLKFFITNTNTPKNVFSDSAFATSIGSEVRLDGSGGIPDIFLDGAYKVRETDSAGNIRRTADPIGVDSVTDAFDLWVVSTTYNIPDIVKGSNNLFYQSLADSNLGNDPTSNPAQWEQFFFFPTWNTAQTYAAGQLVIASDGRSYQSQLGANTGNNPTLDDGTNWQQLLQQDDDAILSGINLEKIEAGTANLDFVNAGNLRWRWLFDTDEGLDLERYNSSGVLQDKMLSFDNVAGTLDVITAGTLSINTPAFLATTPSFTISQTAAAATLEVTSNALQTASIEFQDVDIKRWQVGQDSTNSFSLTSFDASGLNPQTVITFPNGTTDVGIPSGNMLFPLTNQGIAVTSTSNSSFDFNFTGLTTNTATIDFFDNTITSGDRLFNIWKGDTTNEITFQINPEDGSIHPAFDRAGEADPGVKLNKITLSSNAPSGGEDGDLWLQF